MQKLPGEICTDSTSPTKRASSLAKIAKEKEETLRMYEESSKKCDEIVDAILGKFDGTEKSTTMDASAVTSTGTVWIRTKNKAKVISNTTTNVTAPVENHQRRKLRLADKQVSQIAYRGGVRANHMGDKKVPGTSSYNEPEKTLL